MTSRRAANLAINVSNAEDLSSVSREEQHRVARADIGFIGQNVYL